MKRTHLFRQMLSAVLALVLLLGMTPAVLAADDGKCPCGSTYNRIVLKQANCHEQGVVEYICTNVSCSAGNYNKSQIVKTPVDPANHDSIYKDNNDGTTHTASCRYHTEYKNVTEQHVFINGYCTKCAAADYSLAVIVMNSTVDTYVNLNDAQASLSIGDAKVMVGNIDVTENYTISYSWMDQNGTTVGSGYNYQLPAAITSKVGDYTYGCFVLAMPKAGTAGKYISESCTVSVHVRELVLVNAKDPAFLLSSTNNHTSASVVTQIYQAAYKLSNVYPSYVIFGTIPTSDVGVLAVNNAPYYFSPAVGQQNLSAVTFTPSGTAGGTYTINFTVYDTAGKDFPGVLTISVEKDLGTLDLVYTTTPNVPLILSGTDFTAFWQKTHPTGILTMTYFKSLPTIREGVLYYNYNAAALSQTPVTTLDMFYSTPTNATQKLIDGVTFVPDAKFTGLVTIPFEQYGSTNLGQYTTLSGTLSIFVSAGAVMDVACTVDSGTALTLNPADFLSVHQLVTGSTTNNFSIKLLDAPVSGSLYVDYTGTAADRPLTAATVSTYTFHYSNPLGKEISDLTYICPKSATTTVDTIRYAVCDSKGEFEYIGKLVITGKASIVVYTKYFVDVIKTPNTEWYYTPVMELAEAGVIGGMTPTTYVPQGEVTYAQALKLIMLAAGYNVPTQVGTHWASGYLAMAQADGLVSTALTESHLDRKIDRNNIAQIAAKALKLPASTLTTSPFSDVVVGTTYASYIFSLYEAGIVGGTHLSDGSVRYYGVNSITRAEIATIIWRIYNYKKA